MVGQVTFRRSAGRDRLLDNLDDIKDKARERYETAYDRLGRATNVLRGKEESRIFGKVGVLLIGVCLIRELSNL